MILFSLIGRLLYGKDYEELSRRANSKPPVAGADKQSPVSHR